MGTGSKVTAEEQFSVAMLNNKFILAEEGATVEAEGNPLSGQVASIISDGSTLKKNRLYVWDELNSIWIDQANPAHTHLNTDQGGSYYDIRKANSAVFWGITESDLLWQVSSGTAPTYSNTIASTDGYREITTAGAANSAGNYVKAGLRYTFGSPLFAQFRANFSSVNSSVTTRIGFNMEYAHISSNAAVKLGVEACDTCNGVNLRVVSADGTTRSASNTASDAMTSTSSYKLTYTPGVNLVYQKANGTAITKTSNIPSSGSPDRSNVFVAGIMTTNTTAKSQKLWGLNAFGTMNSESNEWV